MIRRPPSFQRSYSPFPDTTLFRSLRIARRECARRSARQILQRAEGPDGVRRGGGRRLQETLGLVGAAAVDEGMTFGTGELDGNLACQPALDVESGIVQHRLEIGRAHV